MRNGWKQKQKKSAPQQSIDSNIKKETLPT